MSTISQPLFPRKWIADHKRICLKAWRQLTGIEICRRLACPGVVANEPFFCNVLKSAAMKSIRVGRQVLAGKMRRTMRWVLTKSAFEKKVPKRPKTPSSMRRGRKAGKRLPYYATNFLAHHQQQQAEFCAARCEVLLKIERPGGLWFYRNNVALWFEGGRLARRFRSTQGCCIAAMVHKHFRCGRSPTGVFSLSARAVKGQNVLFLLIASPQRDGPCDGNLIPLLDLLSAYEQHFTTLKTARFETPSNRSR